MPERDLVELFVAPLERIGARYLVTGSVAAMLYGEPRVTHDIDLVLAMAPSEIGALESAFPVSDYYVPPPEVLRAELGRSERGHFNLIHYASGLKADFYVAGTDELHSWAYSRARSYEMGGRTVRIAPPEYVILRKLELFREGGSEKHVRDIRAMLAVSGDLIDRDALEDWVERRGLGREWGTVAA